MTKRNPRNKAFVRLVSLQAGYLFAAVAVAVVVYFLEGGVGATGNYGPWRLSGAFAASVVLYLLLEFTGPLKRERETYRRMAGQEIASFEELAKAREQGREELARARELVEGEGAGRRQDHPEAAIR